MKGEGRWITIRGQHIFISEGETPMDAYIRYVAKKKQEKYHAPASALNIPTREDVLRKAKYEGNKSNKWDFDDNEFTEARPRRSENKYRVENQMLLHDEEKRPGTAWIPTKREMMNYYIKRAAKENNNYFKDNAEKLAEEYIKYREELKRKANNK